MSAAGTEDTEDDDFARISAFSSLQSTEQNNSEDTGVDEQKNPEKEYKVDDDEDTD